MRPEIRSRQTGAADNLQWAAECLRVLAHPVRLRLVQLLLKGRYPVGQLAADCGVPGSQASEHLRLMQQAGMLTSDRVGQRVYYRVAEPSVEKIINCLQRRLSAPEGPAAPPHNELPTASSQNG